jgi:long-chain acyl-CoA synthetase
MQQIPGIAQAMVVGDRQPYLCALVTLDVEAIPGIALELGIEDTSLAALAADPALRETLQNRIETDCNAKVARYQTIKKFEILPVEFSVDGGELTPTMKLRRAIVTERYADAIAAFYEA